MMYQNKRLKQKLEELQALFDLLSEKIPKLRSI